MKFAEALLEKALIAHIAEENIQHSSGITFSRNAEDVLLKDDLREFLALRYRSEDISENEIEGIIRKLEVFSSSALYESNRDILRLVSDGFVMKREDQARKDH